MVRLPSCYARTHVRGTWPVQRRLSPAVGAAWKAGRVVAAIVTLLHAEVHRTYCPNCPTHNGPEDEEAASIRAGVEQGFIDPCDAVFPCGWRPRKLCRGICESLGVVGRPRPTQPESP